MIRPDIVTRFKAMPVGALLRHFASISIVLGSFWVYGGSYITARADSAIEQSLRRLGISPEDFKKMQAQTLANGGSLASLEQEIETLQSQLGTLSGQISNQSVAVGGMAKQFDQLNSTLTQLLLQRRSSIDSIPPFPGPVSP